MADTVTTSATVSFAGNVYIFSDPTQALELVNHINYMQGQVEILSNLILSDTATLTCLCTPANQIG
jgi:hypothetical protein